METVGTKRRGRPPLAHGAQRPASISIPQEALAALEATFGAHGTTELIRTGLFHFFNGTTAQAAGVDESLRKAAALALIRVSRSGSDAVAVEQDDQVMCA